MPRERRKPLAHFPTRLSPEDLDRAERLVDSARDWDDFEDQEPTLSGMIRKATRIGLAELEKRAAREAAAKAAEAKASAARR